ncbi:GlcNAc-domain-containing protein [Paraphysoderma sedebokerense]|nr:GlcNAc-domain-containing protein [Paraphysoderma sedebokerense]
MPTFNSLFSTLPTHLQLQILSNVDSKPAAEKSGDTNDLPRFHDDVQLSHIDFVDVLCDLSKYGFCVIDCAFLKAQDAALKESDVWDMCEYFNSSGQLHPAGIGTNMTRKKDPSIRGDLMKMFPLEHPPDFGFGDGDSSNGDQRRTAAQTMEMLKKHMEKSLWFINHLLFASGTSVDHDPLFQSSDTTTSLHPSIGTLESQPPSASSPTAAKLVPKAVQLAFYPPNGSQYVKHKDSSPLNPHRKLTMIYYTTRNWTRESGGNLRLFLPPMLRSSEMKADLRRRYESIAEVTVDVDNDYINIAPLSDRLLLFKSDMEHMVLPNHNCRFALTMWSYMSQSLDTYLNRFSKTQESVRGRYPILQTPKKVVEFISIDTSKIKVIQTSTIFVSIASYRDPETHPTVSSLFSNATFPHRIHVGIFYQDSTSDDYLHPLLVLPPSIDNDRSKFVKVIQLDSKYATGPVPARARIMDELYDGEDWFMQIDSHMRFEKGWDVEFVKSLLWLQESTGDNRNLLSWYPPAYVYENSSNSQFTPASSTSSQSSKSESTDIPAINSHSLHRTQYHPPLFYPHHFSPSTSILHLSARPSPFPLSSTTFISQPFVAAGFLFAPGTIVSQVPYNKRLEWLFIGEEIGYAVRLFTRGWKVWCRGGEIMVRHLWDRSGRNVVWDSVEDREKEIKKFKSQRFIRYLLSPSTGDNPFCKDQLDDNAKFKETSSQAGDVAVKNDSDDYKLYGKYGLGTARSLKEFEESCGVDFKTCQIDKEKWSWLLD